MSNSQGCSVRPYSVSPRSAPALIISIGRPIARPIKRSKHRRSTDMLECFIAPRENEARRTLITRVKAIGDRHRAKYGRCVARARETLFAVSRESCLISARIYNVMNTRPAPPLPLSHPALFLSYRWKGEETTRSYLYCPNENKRRPTILSSTRDYVVRNGRNYSRRCVSRARGIHKVSQCRTPRRAARRKICSEAEYRGREELPGNKDHLRPLRNITSSRLN